MTMENIERTLDIGAHTIDIQGITTIKTKLQWDETFTNGLCNNIMWST